ncbi:trehalose operon repressor [Streptococcus dentasini]
MKKYQKVFQDLERKIAEGFYQPETAIPSENDLAKTYKVSRDTVRKALKLLEKTGLVQKSQGRQTLVLRRQHFNFPVSHLTSYQELVDRLGLESQTRVLSLDRLIVDQKLRDLTSFPLGKQVWRITRQRLVNGTASVLDIDYLLTDLVKQITKEIAQRSLYDYLENQLHLLIDTAEKEITIEQMSEQDKIWLDVGSEHHVVSIRSRVYLADGQQFQFTESRHLLEKFHFVDFAKRKP